MSKKDLSVQILKNEEKINKKNLEIYSIFKSNLKKLKKNTFVVGVSGGPDSLALVGLSKELQYERKIKVFYALVDHSVRKDSAKEAILVKKLLKKKKIALSILKNKKKITKNIQGIAREVRYKLLLDFCKKKKADYILTAHHSDDQIETFLIRLSRGSGVQGLSSMKFQTKLSNKVLLVRPLLDIKKNDLIRIAKQTFGKIFKDPSNKDIKYLRTRMRYLKNILEKSGIHHDQIIKSIKNLSSTRDTINNYILKIYKTNVQKKGGKILINFKNISLESREIQLKIFSHAIRDFLKSYYPPRSKKIMNIIENLHSNKKHKFTLAGCLIEKSGSYILISKEA
jgi:tRNA(Ile)-lysidine synthase